MSHTHLPDMYRNPIGLMTACGVRIVILVAALLSIQTSNAVAQADTLWYGNMAFADGRYDDAIVAYQAAVNQGSNWSWLPDLIQSVEIRRDLGTIAPSDTHSIRFIFVTEIRASTDSGLVVTQDATAEQKAHWSVFFGMLRQTLESFSGGAWTIRYDTVSATSRYVAGAPLDPDNPDHLDLAPYFFSTTNDVDTYITLSNTRSPARGLARTYPFVNGVLYGPPRGMAAVNAGTHGYDVLLHEFFHTVEWVSNAIAVTHGYTDANRGAFPGWTGTSEFDYYRWQFSDTLSHIGWRRLNHRTRWISFPGDANALATLEAAYGSIPFSERKEADTLVTEGNALLGTDTLSAAAKWQQALALSPYHLEGLLQLHDYYRFSAADPVQAAELYERLRTLRRITDFSTIDTSNANAGDVIGFWHREDLSEAWGRHTWNVSGMLSGAGTYDISFFYTKGWQGMDIDSVFLMKDGVEISRDDHNGFSGQAKLDNVYRLGVTEFDTAATYTLEATIKGRGGIDSQGQIQIRQAGGATTVGSENEVPETDVLYPNFPNPANPTTQIIFRLARAGHVRLDVYDLLGRRIAVMADEFRPVGEHQILWNASDVSSGMYFLRLQTTAAGRSPFVTVRKMLVLR